MIAEQTEDQKQAVITAFDPSKGRGSELTRISVDPETKTGPFELSPDGSRLAVIRNTGSPLQILSIKGVVLQEIKIPTWDDSGPIRWAPDNESLYIPVAAPEGASLLRVRLRGGVHVLRTNRRTLYLWITVARRPTHRYRHLDQDGKRVDDGEFLRASTQNFNSAFN